MTSIRKGARRKENLKWNLKFNAVGVLLRRTLSHDGKVIILFVDSKAPKFYKEKSWLIVLVSVGDKKCRELWMKKIFYKYF